MTTEAVVKSVLGSTLNLGSRAAAMDQSTPLIGAIPELDSMAVVGILTGLEEYYGFAVNDDEISAESFETLGSLVAFVERKLNER